MKHSDPSKPTPAPFGLSLGQCALVMAAILILSAVGIQMLERRFFEARTPRRSRTDRIRPSGFRHPRRD